MSKVIVNVGTASARPTDGVCVLLAGRALAVNGVLDASGDHLESILLLIADMS